MRKEIYELVFKLRQLISEKLKAYHRQIPYFLIIFFAVLTALAGIIAFTELTENLYDPELIVYEAELVNLLVSLRSPDLTKMMVFFTEMGDLKGYIIITVLITATFRIR
jgi:undecaprenyl-diphosphatase